MALNTAAQPKNKDIRQHRRSRGSYMRVVHGWVSTAVPWRGSQMVLPLDAVFPATSGDAKTAATLSQSGSVSRLLVGVGLVLNSSWELTDDMFVFLLGIVGG